MGLTKSTSAQWALLHVFLYLHYWKDWQPFSWKRAVVAQSVQVWCVEGWILFIWKACCQIRRKKKKRIDCIAWCKPDKQRELEIRRSLLLLLQDCAVYYAGESCQCTCLVPTQDKGTSVIWINIRGIIILRTKGWRYDERQPFLYPGLLWMLFTEQKQQAIPYRYSSWHMLRPRAGC